MEWAIVYGALCTVTDCARQKIARSLLMLGIAAGCTAALWRIWEGTESLSSLGLAVFPAGLFWSFWLLTEGKIGRGDSSMVLAVGLLLGGRLCVIVVSAACLLSCLFAGAGLAAGRLSRNSRLPFAPFLLAAMVLVWLAAHTG